MGAERFLQLFDWNSKSRKKLFPSTSGFPEQSKQGKKSNRSLPAGYDQVVEVESRAGSSVKGSCDHSCASSIVDDDGYNEVQAPSVVARLMGLNCMPTSNSLEPSSTPFFDANSLNSSYYQMELERKNLMHYSRDLDGQSRCSYNSKPRKLPGRPIEKFQSEVLPPSSAKSIPITQHKLLSPIKSSGMFFTGDAAHIMEAAAKIIESGSQAIGKNKMPCIGSSSLPLKVKDLKEKVRAIQERPEMRYSFAAVRVSEKEDIHAVRENISSAKSSTSFRLRDKEKVNAFQEKTSIGSVSFRMKDKDRYEPVQENNRYASSSFRVRVKERVDAADDHLETECSSGSFIARGKARPDPPPKPSRPGQVSERPFESSAAKYMKDQLMIKSWNVSKDVSPFCVTSDAEATTNSGSNKGKSVSLAIQAKVNVQKREGMRLNSSWSKEQQTEVKSHTVKNNNKRPLTQNVSTVLRQNNQQQNHSRDQGTFSKPSSSNSARKKALNEDSSPTRYKSRGNSRTRKSSMDATNDESDQLNSVKNIPRKKRSIDGGITSEGNQSADNGLNNKSQKSKASVDQYAWIEDSREKGMDVVSFTFTSPMTRPSSGYNSSSQMAQISNDLFHNNQRKKVVNVSEHGINVIGSDTLSLFLEQKLRVLTTAIRPSSSDDVKVGSVPKFESHIQNQDAGSTAPKLNGDTDVHSKRLCCRLDSGFQIDPHKGVDEMDACSSNHAKSHLPSPVSILEGCFSAESCNSSHTVDSGFQDSMPCSSVQACEHIGLGPSKRFYHVDTDLSDSASSTTHTSGPIVTNTLQSSLKWELNYVKDIVRNIDIMYENLSLGVANPLLFEELEVSNGWTRNGTNSSKLERKLYFDCVSENLDLRCKRYIGGGCEAWCKGMMTLVKRKERLAEEVCEEISNLSGLSDCMVDELVDKDMSSQHGKWLNFESEEFSLGVEMEVQILNSLVDEMVADLLFH